MIDFKTCKAAARGRWPEIWAALGIGDLPRVGRHGPCPGCGGRDRFRLLPDGEEDGGWICGGGGDTTGGDGFALIVHAGIADLPGQSLRMVAEYLGLDGHRMSKADRRKAAVMARRAEQERLEAALVHELRVLLTVLETRVAGRSLDRNDNFKANRPEWRKPPSEHWDRELLAVRRIAALLSKLYPPGEREAAA